MKLLLSFLMLLVLNGCKTSQVGEGAKKSDFPAELAGTEACFVLYDLSDDKLVEVMNEERCRERTAPCSTFKVPLAVMAVDQGLVKNEKTLFRWDGQKRMMPDWNRDQTAKDWETNSTVWVSRELTRKMGQAKVQKYLEDFGYGNHDFSGGVLDAWLTPAPFLEETPRNSLRISAIEQLEFLKKLYRNELNVKPEAMSLTKRLLPSEVSTLGSMLSGKTGSGFLGEDGKKRLGWYVSHIRTKRYEYLAILTFTDRQSRPDAEFGGRVAKETLKKMLFERGIW